MNIRTLVFASLALVAAIPAIAQEPVVGKPDESLFTDKDPRLHANKQVSALTEKAAGVPCFDTIDHIAVPHVGKTVVGANLEQDCRREGMSH